MVSGPIVFFIILLRLVTNIIVFENIHRVLFVFTGIIILVIRFLSHFQFLTFDLFGLRQVWLNFRGKPYTHLSFDTPFLYKFVRHPLYFGVLLVFWSAGTMSVTRFLFATVFTLYTLKAIQWEEKDLMTHFGDLYRKYAEQVPMIIPSFFNRKSK